MSTGNSIEFGNNSFDAEPIVRNETSGEFGEETNQGTNVTILTSSDEFTNEEAVSIIEDLASTFDGAYGIMFKESIISNLLYLLNFKLDKTDSKISNLQADGTISSEYVTHLLDSGQSNLKIIINDILDRITESERTVFPITTVDWVDSGSDAIFTVSLPLKNSVLGAKILFEELDGSYSQIEISDINQDSNSLTLTIPIDDKFDGYLILN
jgi:hypothetical protein